MFVLFFVGWKPGIHLKLLVIEYLLDKYCVLPIHGKLYTIFFVLLRRHCNYIMVVGELNIYKTGFSTIQIFFSFSQKSG